MPEINAPEIDQNLKKRYEKLLQQQKNARPQNSNQGFLQKAQIFGLKAATTLSFLSPPLALIAAPELADKASRLENPEKYYQINALERLALETGVLEVPKSEVSLSTVVFGMSDKSISGIVPDIESLGIKSDWTKRNEAVQKMAKLVGIEGEVKYPKRTDALKSFFDFDSKDSQNSIFKNFGLAKKFKSKFFSQKGQSFETFFSEENYSQKSFNKGWLNRFLNWLFGPSISETLVNKASREGDHVSTNSQENHVSTNSQEVSQTSKKKDKKINEQKAKEEIDEVVKKLAENKNKSQKGPTAVEQLPSQQKQIPEEGLPFENLQKNLNQGRRH